MRMWMVLVGMLCNQHLLGEHGEIHSHKHIFVKKYSVTGRLFPVVQIEPLAMQSRHDALAQEMLRRGMQHNSPYEAPDVSHIPNVQHAKVNLHTSMTDLIARCPQCRELILSSADCPKEFNYLAL